MNVAAGSSRDDADNGRRGLRPQLTQRLVRDIQRRYRLAEPAEIADLGGSVHLNLAWASEHGRFVVRVYRSHVSPARLEAIQRARGVLAAGRVPTARIIESRAGTTFVTSDEHLVEVEEYVEYDAIMDDWERLAAGMPLLGCVHSLLAGVRSDEPGVEPLYANYVSPGQALAGTQAGAARIRSWQPTAAELGVAEDAERLAEVLQPAEAVFTPELPRQLVHGDFWHNNVCFRLGEPVLVADLDFMGYRARVDDLALTLYFALCELPADERGTQGPDRVAGLVRAYQNGLHDKLSAAERAALPLAMARQPLWSIGGWVARLDDDLTARAHAANCRSELALGLSIMASLDRWQDAVR